MLVRKIRGRWTATLNRAIVPRVRLNQIYADLFQEHRSAKNTELAQHLQEARWTVKNVQQRFSTILMVAEAILKRQQHFLEFGPMAMKPLGLREIAEELGLHESTVSRVTNNKYMATPVGVFELKYFFSREMATASGGACSATAIRGVIKGMIEAESADRAAVGCADRPAAGAPGPAGRAPHRHQVPPAAEAAFGRAPASRRGTADGGLLKPRVRPRAGAAARRLPDSPVGGLLSPR